MSDAQPDARSAPIFGRIVVGVDCHAGGRDALALAALLQPVAGGELVALYVYPFESHTPRAIENNLDLWARWIGWFDQYVKAPGAAATVGAGQ